MKSQAFSMDIMLAVVIFIGTIFVFYSILSGGDDESKITDLEDEASTVLGNIATEDSDVRITETEGIAVDEAKLEDLLEMEYSEIKKKIRVKNEFCIYLEDDEGNVIPIQDQSGVGSGKIKIGGEGCSPDCNDGIDNDEDGKIDFGNDPGCSGIDDNDESN